MGRRFYDLRAGMEHKKLAAAAGVEPQRIYAIENGVVPRGDNLVALARALGTTAEYLFYGEGPARVASSYTTPPADDPVALKALSSALAGIPGLAPGPAELSTPERDWLRAMSGHPSIADYAAALTAWRHGEARAPVVIERPVKGELEAPHVPRDVTAPADGISHSREIRDAPKPATKKKTR